VQPQEPRVRLPEPLDSLPVNARRARLSARAAGSCLRTPRPRVARPLRRASPRLKASSRPCTRHRVAESTRFQHSLALDNDSHRSPGVGHLRSNSECLPSLECNPDRAEGVCDPAGAEADLKRSGDAGAGVDTDDRAV